MSPSPEPETTACRHALVQWEEFSANARAARLFEAISGAGSTDPGTIAAALRVFPGTERRPVAAGVFLEAGGTWTRPAQTGFLDEFIADPAAAERDLLEIAARGAVPMPGKLPVTIEEFPSRIWQRAKAHNQPSRMLAAAFQSTHAALLLLWEHCCAGEDAAESNDSKTVLVPSGDLPPWLDLVAMPPPELEEMKRRVMKWIKSEALAGRLSFSVRQGPMLDAWISTNGSDAPEVTRRIRDEAAAMMAEFAGGDRLRGYHHTRRLGRFLFRLGLRRESIRCGKALGLSPWEYGWHLQPLRPAAHARIRNRLTKPGVDTDRWLTEPALACSAMSIPLWLQDGVCRLPELTALFHQAHTCPWLYPRLHHIYQWHLALAGKQRALRQVEELDPELSVGLATPSEARTQP